jgi:type II secretory pathway pseudopilin PulG
MRHAGGFGLVELVVALAICLVVSGAMLALLAGNQSALRLEPEAADTQQRLRVAAEALQRDLSRAGTGLAVAVPGGSGQLIPAVRPGRYGLTRSDHDLAYASDRITVVYATRPAARARLALDMGSPVADLALEADADCMPGQACGFSRGSRALAWDVTSAGRGFDLFTVTATGPSLLEHRTPNAPFSRAYRAGDTRVAAIEQHVYWLDRADGRLVHYDGYQSESPLVDGVLDLRFSYFLDPDPRSVAEPPSGEGSCLYAAADPPAPLLELLPGEAPRLALPAQLVDGPLCGNAPNRFDGDLLRIRMVRVELELGPGEPPQGRQGSRRFRVVFDVSPRGVALLR